MLHFSSLAHCARDTCKASAWILRFLALGSHCAVTLSRAESIFTPTPAQHLLWKNLLTEDESG